MNARRRPAAALGRIVIDGVRPSTLTGLPAKAHAGEVVVASADVFADGHDALAAAVRWRPEGTEAWSEAPLAHVGNDRWEGIFTPEAVGPHELVVVAWRDRWSTWVHGVTAKLAAGVDIAVELDDGAALLTERRERLLDGAPGPRTKLGKALRERGDALVGPVDVLRDRNLEPAERLSLALRPEVAAEMAGPLRPEDLTESDVHPLWVDRERAAVGSWYELFPRSHGGFAGTAARLPAIASMGFDVVYLPPIHPIGRTFRKGPGNTLNAGPDDPGSPWAIGGAEGGHTAVHPDLGTLADFDALVAAAEGLGMEIALDYALQCSPDHPWVRDHPEWFTQRSDGSIAYAENPPKKYQDIHPISFWPEKEDDRVALWDACLDVLRFWIARGVRIFRVDNPHTKPTAFWAWAIAEVQRDHPDVVFLAEAFTRPKVMSKLAEVGFSQSYTYFTWRTTKQELGAYLLEVSEGRQVDWMRPAFWPNTPDILAEPLRDAPLSAFAMRAVLAATMVPTWGVYSGFELGETAPASPDNEEYARSEKYEIKQRDFDHPGSLAPLLTRLNAIRRRHPALQRLRGARLHSAWNESIVAYSRSSADGADVVLVVVNLDPSSAQDATLSLDLAALGVAPGEPFRVHDELSGETYQWYDSAPWVRLDPAYQPAHILHVAR